jgi:quercetin dioxygenase-like cupin family protein
MTEYVDVAAALAAEGPRIRWTVENQLQANLVRLEPDAVVDEHTERELDVLLVVVAGDGALYADGRERWVAAPAVVSLPAGTRRAILAGSGGLAYVTAHRRRTGMRIG